MSVTLPSYRPEWSRACNLAPDRDLQRHPAGQRRRRGVAGGSPGFPCCTCSDLHVPRRAPKRLTAIGPGRSSQTNELRRKQASTRPLSPAMQPLRGSRSTRPVLNTATAIADLKTCARSTPRETMVSLVHGHHRTGVLRMSPRTERQGVDVAQKTQDRVCSKRHRFHDSLSRIPDYLAQIPVNSVSSRLLCQFTPSRKWNGAP